MAHLSNSKFTSLNLVVLTVSDTRSLANDTSGDFLQESAMHAGHKVQQRKIVIDDIYQIRAILSQWIADSNIHCVLITGGTGFTARDNTPEAITPLFDKQVEGFGELFRSLSYQQIGTSAMQSRALAGLANNTIIFAMPGSTGACKDAWAIISEQINSTHTPCNFVPHLNLN